MKRSGIHYQNYENQSQTRNLYTDWHAVSNSRVIAPQTLIPNFWPCCDFNNFEKDIYQINFIIIEQIKSFENSFRLAQL